MILNNNNIKKVIGSLQSKAHDKALQSLDALCNDVAKTTQRNFNLEIPNIPADDPYVEVNQTPTFYVSNTKIGRKIECKGNQVLFIEFGAGIHEQNRTKTMVVVENVEFDYATRPYGIVPIGTYGKGHGMDDFWFYSSKTGRGSMNAEQIRYNTKSNTYTMITIGIRPVRALYRALGTAFKKLGSGRLKIK